jgi:hypothetical protein
MGTDNSTCTRQLGNNVTCTRDEQCVNTHGCNNGACTEYFSLANGANVSNSASNKWSVCASGEVDTNNKCRTRMNTKAADVPCTGDCSYTNADNTTTVEVGSCKCALNASGNKFCVLANGNF